MDDLQNEFVKYQQILDAYYDKRERIYQRSREIAIESKRIIFLLHRPRRLEAALAKEAENRLQNVRDTRLLFVAKELNGEDYSMFQGSYRFGVQEYIEALLLYYFLTKGLVASLEDVRQLLLYKDKQHGSSLFVHVSVDDYVAAVLDFGGELMRHALNAFASGGDQNLDRLCQLMQRLFICIKLLPYRRRYFTSKLQQFRTSVRKVEKARFVSYLRHMDEKQCSFTNWLPSLTIGYHHSFSGEIEMSKEEESE